MGSGPTDGGGGAGIRDRPFDDALRSPLWEDGRDVDDDAVLADIDEALGDVETTHDVDVIELIRER